MEGFSINYVLINMKLREIGDHINAFSEEIRKLTEYAENLDIFWDGDANDAYKIRLYGDIGWMMSTVSKVTELMEMCDKALTSYQETEKVIQQMIGGFGFEKQDKKGN